MKAISSMFELAIELRDNGESRHAINILQKILNDYPTYNKKHLTHSVLGGIHTDLKEYKEALPNFKTATELNPKSELASLGLYITLHHLDRDMEAIQELIRYLKIYPANLYKDTLEELLEGLKNGYMTDYEDDIKNFARINGIEF